jgi:hypothetical protein
MVQGTIVYGIFLIVLGVASYILTNAVSLTALIPSYFGLIVLPMGLLSLLKPAHKRHFLHVAAAVALLGILGTVGGLMRAFQMLGGAEMLRPEATIAQATMCAVSIVFLAFCIRSFINARVLKKTA